MTIETSGSLTPIGRATTLPVMASPPRARARWRHRACTVSIITPATYIKGEFVALKHLNLEDHMRPISDLSNYKVEEGDIDPRGWTVVGNDGNRIGTVEDLIVDTRAMKVRYLVV